MDVLKEMGQHARWKASRLNREVYGDKVDVKHAGEVTNTVQFYLPDNSRDKKTS